MRKKIKVLVAASKGFLELMIIIIAGKTHHSGVTAISWNELPSGTSIAIKAVYAPIMTLKVISLGQVRLIPPNIFLITLFMIIVQHFLAQSEHGDD